MVYLIVLTRIYGAEALAKNNYSNILNSVAFAGTIVGMVSIPIILEFLLANIQFSY